MRLSKYRNKYCVYERKDGVVTRRSLGTDDRAEAERRFADYKSRRLSNLTSNPLIKDLWEARIKKLEGRRTAQNMTWSGLPIIAFFGHLQPQHITPELCKQYITHRQSQGRKPWTIYTELSHLKSTLLPTGYSGNVYRPNQPPPKDQHITKEEARSLLSSDLPVHLRTYIVLGLSTGARNQAILDLTWGRIDLEKKLIDLRTEDMTNKKGRATVPINDTLFTTLQPLKGLPNEYVVSWGGNKVTSVRKALKAAGSKVGLPWISPHILRHSAAVWMAEAGVSLEEISQFLGHSSIEITRKIYAKFTPSYLRKAANALELTNEET